MHHDQDPRDAIGRALPDAEPPANFDLDRIISDGYRARRRNRVMLTGTTALGVGLLAGATALAVSLGTAAVPEETPVAAEDFGFDTAMAGYPWDDDGAWADGDDGETPPENWIGQDATAVFGPLFEETELDFDVRAMQRPGNGGQVYLRSLIGQFYSGEEPEDSPPMPLTLEVLLPGGWTAVPGPVTEEEFPQHLISDEASYTDAEPQFTTGELEDGRTLMAADHGCAYDLAVAYPNGTGLRVSWDTGCTGEQYPVDLGELIDAALAMPEYDFDTSELTPIEELMDVPAGWPYDEQWNAEAAEDAQESLDAALAVIDAAHPGAEFVSPGGPTQAYSGNSTTVRRGYGVTGRLPYEDAAEIPIVFSMSYTLPGGWIEGFETDSDTPDLYLITCSSEGEKNEDCEETEVDGRTVVTRTLQVGDSHSYFVYVFDPDGWAVQFETSFAGEIDGLDLQAFIELTASLPAPVYDADAYPGD